MPIIAKMKLREIMDAVYTPVPVGCPSQWPSRLSCHVDGVLPGGSALQEP